MKEVPFTLAFLAGALAAADHAAVFSYVQKSCTGCHNASVKSGDIDLKAALAGPESFDRDRVVWEKAVEKMKTGQMPPPGAPKPAAAATASVIRTLEAEFDRLDRLVKPDPGRVTARRLNKAEYNNTVRDLFGTDLRPADRFPADNAAYGFDNNSDALLLSPALLEQYLDAAEQVVRHAVFGPPAMKPAAIHYPTPVRINILRGTPSPLPKDLFHYDETGLSTVHSAHVLHRFPVDAEYSFRLVLNGHRPNQSEPARPAFYLDGKLVKEFEVDATDLEGQIVELRTFVTAGEHLLSATYHKNYHGLPPSYGGPDPSKRPPEALISTRGQLSEKDIETLRKYGTRIKTDGLEIRVDNRYESIDVGGPFNQKTGPPAASRQRIFVCGEQTTACATAIVKAFAGRAYRRPATAAEVSELTGYYTLARSHGESFDEGIATALQAALVKPQFLFRMEQDRPAATKGGNAAPLDGYELASRLSYFLWSSMPDNELWRLAGQNRLREPAVLTAQVRRMLRDPKAAALVENFAGQWLQFKNVDVLRPDHEKFRDFEDSLRLAMRRETELFMEHLIREDRSVLEVLDAGYTFVNERLARFYGIEGVTGPEFRRVDMRNSPRGGGVLAHASILTVSSYSTRTSPVLRGKWILETLLHAPPPAPPPGVPPLDASKAGLTGTLREQMEQHRANPACASCHTRMDALGFGLENFDAVGAWRTHDGKFPVDAAGRLPDGRAFQTPGELKKLLVEEREAYVTGLTTQLLTYALGRGLERYDRPVVKAIAGALPARQYRFSELVLEIVKSLPFQSRRAKETTKS